MLAVLTAVLLASAPAERPTLLVLDVSPGGGLEPAIATAFTEAIGAELSRFGYFDVRAASDVQTVLGLERQKELMGCAEDASQCLAELAGALGARFVLSASLTRLGGQLLQLNVQVLDSQRVQPVGRVTRTAPDLATLRRQLSGLLAEASGLPPPAPPSRVLPYSLLGGGAVLAGFGTVFGLQTLAREETLRTELELGVQHRAVLNPLEYYREQDARLAREKTLSLVAVLTGLAAAGLGGGLLLFESEEGARVELLVAPGAVGVQGVLP